VRNALSLTPFQCGQSGDSTFLVAAVSDQVFSPFIALSLHFEQSFILTTHLYLASQRADFGNLDDWGSEQTKIVAKEMRRKP
jgi:hypothetical protein